MKNLDNLGKKNADFMYVPVWHLDEKSRQIG
jgi:hypothetical protein